MVAVCAAFIAAASIVSDRPPNVVIILADDQGYGDLGCFGSQTIATPEIDRLAEQGARLTSFYASAPICTPTRASLMTGCYAARVGLSTPLHVYDGIGLHADEVTLPEAMRRCGYRTACIGKWHLGHLPEHYPTRHGFDMYWGTPLGHMFQRAEVGKAIGDTSDLFLDNEREIPFPPSSELTEQFTQQAVAFIKANRDQPFFLLLAHTMPHEPLAVSPRFAGRNAAGLYGDVIQCIDWSTGQIVQTLQQLGISEDTIVVYTSDNGPKKGHGSAGPLRGFKHQPYEGGVRVPCVVWAPGRVAPGRDVACITTIMDLYPTFVQQAGGTVDSKQVCDGRDLSRLLFTEEAVMEPVRKEFFYFVRHGKLVGLRQGRWKLLLQQGTTAELYDLNVDIAEQHNLAAAHPEIVDRFASRIRQFENELSITRRLPEGRYRDLATRPERKSDVESQP